MEKKSKIPSEKETRESILKLAFMQGCLPEAKSIFERYDRLFKGCSDLTARKQMAVMAIAELHKLLNCQGALVVDGVEILPALKTEEELEQLEKGNFR